MKKIAMFFTLCLCAIMGLQAHQIDSTTALMVARHFYANLDRMQPQIPNAVIVYKSEFTQVENVGGRAVAKQIPGFYVANFGNEGFVIVAADDRVDPILAFSTEGAFVTENMPAHIQFFLNGYISEIQQVVNENFIENTDTKSKWTALIEGTAGAWKDGTVVVGPLLGNNQWNQTKYYNDKCPADATGNAAYGGHAAVGCGAIVMGQVMRYWRYPETGIGSHSYNHPSYGTLSANFANTHYNFSAMSDKLVTTFHPDSCVDAISTLLYHCGVAVNMYYGAAASTANSNYIVSAMSTYFGYPNTVQYVERGSISATNWLNHIKEELDERAPFMYGGSGNYGGHVWTCDGYRDDDYLHFNWGWGGTQNGYFAITSCSSYGFNSNHAVIVGIRGPELPDVSVTEQETNSNIVVYPNPTSGKVQFATESELLNSEVKVFDINGKYLFTKKIDSKNMEIDLTAFASGMYYLNIVTGNQVVKTCKVVKQ